MSTKTVPDLTAAGRAIRQFGEAFRRCGEQIRNADEQRRRDRDDWLDWLGEWGGRRG